MANNNTNILNLPTEETLQSIATALTTMQGNVSGVKGNEESVFRTGQVNLTPANIGALPASTTYVSSVNGGSGVVTGIATQQELDEVRSIAEGAGSAISFATYASMISTFNNAADDDYKVGQSVYINTQGIPDLWVYEVSDTQILYYHTTDAAFIATLQAQGYVQVGWYKLAALESDVNLSNYMTLDGTQTVTGLKSFTDFSLINDYTNGKTLARYLSDKAGLADNNTFTGNNTFSNSVSFGFSSIYQDSSDRIVIKYGNDDRVKVGSAGVLFIGRIDPDSNNTYDIGRDSLRWRDGYFAGQVYAQNTFNKINVSDMTDSTHFTQAQLDLITNGKSTFVNGVLLGVNSPMISSLKEMGGNYYGLMYGWADGQYESFVMPMSIITSQLRVSLDTNPRIITEIKKLNRNASGYGINVPSSASWTADKTLATDDIISDAYDNTATYAVGDCCIYNNTLYKCKTAITTAENFDSTKWDAITITELISNETIVINELKQATFNVINANEIINNTLTDEQYTIITNGKPTLIKGTYQGFKNMMLMYWYEYSNSWRCVAFAETNIFSMKLRTDTKELEQGGNDIKIDKVAKLNVQQINSKALPNYPSNTGTFTLKCVNGTLTWVAD